ncbi:unnamed protein product [Parnassius apollo]|uniref:(apollo) hypothetical protein n=1 Tax=Parnassius apollo TaxID=110799 RepID=A0A8S3WMS2_PARAO|nr:unnamed protein product [Parnassius apollo]
MESPSPNDTKIDVEHLIITVQERPPLWNKHSKEYSDRNLKTRLWQEVCENVIQNWAELSKQNKKTRDTSGNIKSIEECANSETQSDEDNSQQKQDTRKAIYQRKTGAQGRKENTDEGGTIEYFT